MEPSEAASRLAAALRDDRLAVLVGAGASADSRDQSGRPYRGLPLPSEFVRALAQQRDTAYVDESSPFELACEQVVNRDSRRRLEELLVRAYSRPATLAPPPAHKILAWLPFRAYITSNYDQFLERQLATGARRPGVIIENEDLARMRRGEVPVIKYHGCVSRPSTMVATPSDYVRRRDRSRLLRQLITVNLARNNLLVIGHGLEDDDLKRLLDDVLEDLDEYAPTLYIVREPARSGEGVELGHRHHIILEDLTQFLSRILHEYRSGDLGPSSGPGSSVFDEDWINSAFFAQLRQASVLPSETQVIDAFLEHLADELSARGEVGSVRDDADVAVDRALEERPNYSALRRIWDELRSRFDDATEDVATAEEIVHDLIEHRESKKTLFRQLGRRAIERDDRVLVYSQSQRVIQTLQGVPPAVQRTCDLFVAECRPKSPAPYEDAAAICRELADTDYSISVCPDVVAINLLANSQISRVLMGTHAIYVDDAGVPYAFVNTCGSLAIAIAADRFKVPIIVVGEELKLESVPAHDADDHLYSHQEHDLLSVATGLVELATRRDAVEHTNIGYDLVRLTANMTIEVPDAVARP